MEYSFFLAPFLVAFFTALTLLIVIIAVSRKKIFANDSRSSMRHLHHKGISRFGGIAIILAFVISLLLDSRLVVTNQLLAVLMCAGAILVFGVIDDLRQINWKWQLVFQLMIVMAVYLAGVKLQYITNPAGGIFSFENGGLYFLGSAISIIWVIFLMNAINFADGMDGVAGGITLIASATIFLISLRPEVNQPPVGIITAALVGALFAFLIFNFNPAKIIAGTSGSMFMGFILAVLAIFAGAKIATTLLVLAVPILDAFWVIGERIRRKKSIFLPDQSHLHFRLLQLGWSVKKIVWFYYLVTLVIAILSLNMRALGKFTTLIIFACLFVFVLMTIEKKIYAMRNKQ